MAARTEPGTLIELASLPNLRDIGGYPARGGRVQTGVLYGKDSTGWAAAATLTLLGVSEEDVLADFLITNRDLLPALKPYFDRFASVGGDPALLTPVLGVETAYLHAAFDETHNRFGSIEAYFSEGLRIDADDQQSLHAILVK